VLKVPLNLNQPTTKCLLHSTSPQAITTCCVKYYCSWYLEKWITGTEAEAANVCFIQLMNRQNQVWWQKSDKCINVQKIASKVPFWTYSDVFSDSRVQTSENNNMVTSHDIGHLHNHYQASSLQPAHFYVAPNKSVSWLLHISHWIVCIQCCISDISRVAATSLKCKYYSSLKWHLHMSFSVS